MLLLLMNISLHTLIISGSLYWIFLMEMVKNKEYKNKKVLSEDAELVFNSLLLAENAKSVNNEKLNLYNSINEWKEFCHKQILDGKLDVIA